MSEVFDAGNGVPANFNDGTVKVAVNGSNKGNQRVNPGETLGAFLKRTAQTYGVRTFSAFADGRKLDTADAAKPLVGVTAIEIVAKDSRGLQNERLRYIWTAPAAHAAHA